MTAPITPQAVPSFSDVGLPEGHAYPELAYHAPTNSIIVHTRPLDSVLPIRRLSIRHASESRYRLICDFPPSISVESFALSTTQAALYLLTYTWSEYPNGPVGGHWDALYRFSLDTGQSEMLVRRGELILQTPHRSAWLKGLLSISADGRTVFCSACLQTMDFIGHHYLSEFSIADRKLTLISRLQAVFA